jgi:hypothetical protein
MSSCFANLPKLLDKQKSSFCDLYFPTDQFSTATDSLIPPNIPPERRQCFDCHLKNEYDDEGNFKRIPESEKKCLPTCTHPTECQRVADLQKEIIPIPERTLFEVSFNGPNVEPASQFALRSQDNPVSAFPIPTFFSSNLKRAAEEQDCELLVHKTNNIFISKKPWHAKWIHLLKYILIEGQEYDAFFERKMHPVKVKLVDGVLLIKF